MTAREADPLYALRGAPIRPLLAGRQGASGILPPAATGEARGPGGVCIRYEVFGGGPRTVLLLPPWQILHSRTWKFQVPYLARYFRVITFDPRGAGRSDRPPSGYGHDAQTGDALAVMDATGTERAVAVGFSRSATHALLLAHRHPERVEKLVLLASAVPLWSDAERAEFLERFRRPRTSYAGWEQYNAEFWRSRYEEFLWFFFSEMFSEPHGLKGRCDGVSWGRQTTPDVLIATIEEGAIPTALPDALPGIRQPVLIVHGAGDRIRPHAQNARPLRERLPNARLLTVEGGGHALPVREPVRVNRLLRDVTGVPVRDGRWAHALTAPRRVLWVCSPVGLGHVRRDLSIAQALRDLDPALQIDWLAVDPVRAAVQAAGERVHPASDLLFNESAHVEALSAEHDVNVFLALWDMDEVFAANFMTFLDVVERERYDCWVGDEAWDLDHYLHENPDLKTAPFAFMTDFIGFLPIDDRPDSAEAVLCRDWNAETIAHVARYPAIRDRAIFFGEPDDVMDRPFAPDLPNMRAWAREHFEFGGYVPGFEPAALPEPAALKRELGYDPSRPLVIATAGGTAVGRFLLRKCAEAFPMMRARRPDLEMVIVAGPRTPAGAFPEHDGLRVAGYVPDLFRHLACCDLAITQGGLATCMELVAAQRPFLYFPLANHFEQTYHVDARLRRYGADGRMDYRATSAEALAAAALSRLGAPVGYRAVAHGTERRIASRIASLTGTPGERAAGVRASPA